MGLTARRHSTDKYLANYYLVIFQWILCICIVTTKKYDMRELCNVQEGSVRISLDQGNYVELDLSVNLEGPGTSCEIIIQTTHRGDGLLLYYENFDFVGSNFATVFRREDCGNTILKAWDGEFHYLSSCIGSGLEEAPPMTTFSSLGAVRLQLLPTNLTGVDDGQKATDIGSNSSREMPIKFSIIATASQKAAFTKDCPSGCCNEPYTFRCPLLNQCIDIKLTCNNITNCGPRVGSPRDENGLMCQGVEQTNNGTVLHHILGPADIQRVITADEPSNTETRGNDSPTRNNNDMLRYLWDHGSSSNSIFGEVENIDKQQAYYTRIELVCGIVSIAFFCLAGIAVLVCKSRHSQTFGAYIDRRNASATYIANAERRNPNSGHSGEDEHDGNVISVILARSQSTSELQRPGERNENETDIPHYMAVRPKPHTCPCSVAGNSRDANSAGIYTIDLESGNYSHYCSCNEHPPPPYESLYPK